MLNPKCVVETLAGSNAARVPSPVVKDSAVILKLGNVSPPVIAVL